jgi:hypothetical protein
VQSGFDVNLPPKAGLLVSLCKGSAIRWVFSALSSDLSRDRRLHNAVSLTDGLA